MSFLHKHRENARKAIDTRKSELASQTPVDRVLSSKDFGDFLNQVLGVVTGSDSALKAYEMQEATLSQTLSMSQVAFEILQTRYRQFKQIVDKQNQIAELTQSLSQLNKSKSETEQMLQTVSQEMKTAFAKPTEQGRYTSYFGYRIDPFGSGGLNFHTGLDIAGSGCIMSALSGTVEIAGYTSMNGYYVLIDHGIVNGVRLKTMYAHLASLAVQSGQSVARAQTIGIMGATGAATGIHLHFEVQVNGVSVDPLPYLQ